jgi:RNA-splicing ligase RtcB
MCRSGGEQVSERLGIKDEVVAVMIDLASDELLAQIAPDPLALMSAMMFRDKEE